MCGLIHVAFLFEMKKQELGRSLLPPEELNVPGNSVNRLAAVYLLEPFFL